ncbi:hypothetical protein JJB07_06715 [Tumebacillus sp. ITR2]|uniref:Uncharacterized protein n=1 Tax=Tumebacillus amylolyticus TaxID=2801339 RepID=A0ABS1J7T9_9BACL|nr:hypothetical protein [Tumebacillus amylolyticus]MBL0386335.1 hypothetical protein [Tumebacillus amylolyticus]
MTLVFWADDDKWFKIFVNGHFVCEILAVNLQHAYLKAHHEWAVKKFLKQKGVENTFMLVCEESVAGTETEDESVYTNQLASRIVASPLLARIFKGWREKNRGGT